MKRAVIIAALLCAACGDSAEDSSQGGAAGAQPDGAAAGSSATVADGAAAQGGAASCSDPIAPDPFVPKPTAAEIEFSVIHRLSSGEQILFNDWSAIPNTLRSIHSDGTNEIEVFRAYRIWSLAASHDGKTLAFACGDPLQAQTYGITIGDAIEHTWLYDIAGQTVSVFAWGNINDECHTFNARDDALWVCRRSDFTPEGAFKGYEVARLSLPCGQIALPTAPAADQYELYPRPTDDESSLYYTIVDIVAGKQSRRLVKQSFGEGQLELVRSDATLHALSPDGTRMLFSDHTQASALYVMKIDGSELVKVSTQGSNSAVWSPDGARIAYLWDETPTCSHLQIVRADGSQADSPERLRDCGSSFITELAWLSVP